jgi:hypothetical protein
MNRAQSKLNSFVGLLCLLCSTGACNKSEPKTPPTDAAAVATDGSDFGVLDAELVNLCVQGSTAFDRACNCADAGGRLVVGCSEVQGRCYAYSSDCMDEGYALCAPGADADLLVMCNAFCGDHDSESWAGGCAMLAP